MRGTVYRQCWCRDPDTGRKLHGKCPQLGKRGHDLRHGAASQLKASGADTKLISAILGHSRTSFTDATYVAVFPDVAAAAMDQAAAVVGRIGTRRVNQ